VAWVALGLVVVVALQAWAEMAEMVGMQMDLQGCLLP